MSYDRVMESTTDSPDTLEPGDASVAVAAEDDELTIALTPPQLAVAIAIVAIVAILIIRRRRNGREDDRT